MTIATRALFQKHAAQGWDGSSREGSPDTDNTDGEAVRCAACRWNDDRAARISGTVVDIGAAGCLADGK